MLSLGPSGIKTATAIAQITIKAPNTNGGPKKIKNNVH
jgi:hypothetical protein